MPSITAVHVFYVCILLHEILPLSAKPAIWQKFQQASHSMCVIYQCNSFINVKLYPSSYNFNDFYPVMQNFSS